MKQYVGQKYGRLTVTGQYSRRDDKGRSHAVCVCECECGKDYECRANALQRRLTRSCGCLNAEVRRSGVNRIHKTHSEEAKQRIREKNKGIIHWENVARAAAANRGRKRTPETCARISAALTGRKLSPEHRARSAERARGNKFAQGAQRSWDDAHRRLFADRMRARGDKCPLYVDGKGHERHNERTIECSGVEYKIWRDAVYKRDNYTCQRCGKRGGKLNAHHIKGWWEAPEKRYDLTNGQTLCQPCHRMTPNYARKRAKQTKALPAAYDCLRTFGLLT